MTEITYDTDKTIKVLDIVIDDIENVLYFSIKEILASHREYNAHEQGYLFVEIKSLGEIYDLFKYIDDTDGLYRLTEKGIELKKFRKGFREFKKSLKPKPKKWYNQSWIGFLIAFITLIFALFQGSQNHTLKNDISSLKKSVDSLKNVTLSYNKRLDSLNIQYHFLESQLSDLKKSTEQKKIKRNKM